MGYGFEQFAFLLLDTSGRMIGPPVPVAATLHSPAGCGLGVAGRDHYVMVMSDPADGDAHDIHAATITVRR